MNIPAAEMEELAILCRDMNAGVREQLAAEDDARVKLGRPMRVAKDIGIWVAAFFLFACCVAMVGCHRSDAADRYAELVAAYDASQAADLKEADRSFSDTPVDTVCDQVRAREPAGPFAECPSPCIVKIGAEWCGPCRDEPITAWCERSGWKVHAYDWDRDSKFCGQLGVEKLPTFIVVRSHKEVARYTGTSIQEFLPILKSACQ